MSKKTCLRIIPAFFSLLIPFSQANADISPGTQLNQLPAGTRIVLKRTIRLQASTYQLQGLGSLIHFSLPLNTSCRFSTVAQTAANDAQGFDYDSEPGSVLVLAALPQVRGNFISMNFSQGPFSSFKCMRNGQSSSMLPRTVGDLIQLLAPGAELGTDAVSVEAVTE